MSKGRLGSSPPALSLMADGGDRGFPWIETPRQAGCRARIAPVLRPVAAGHRADAGRKEIIRPKEDLRAHERRSSALAHRCRERSSDSFTDSRADRRF